MDFEALSTYMGFRDGLQAIRAEADAEMDRANGEIRKANGYIADKNRRISALERDLAGKDERIGLLERALADECRRASALAAKVENAQAALDVKHADAEGMAAMAVRLAEELSVHKPDSQLFRPSPCLGDGRLGMHEPYCEAFDLALADRGIAEPWRHRRSAS